MNDPTPDQAEADRTYRPRLPEYVYVASSWRNPTQPVVIEALRACGITCYDFRNPPEATAFSWREVRPAYDGPVHTTEVRSKGADWEPAEVYLEAVNHPRAIEGFASDFAAILLEDPIEPELMYRMCDYLAPSLPDLIDWLGVTDDGATS